MKVHKNVVLIAIPVLYVNGDTYTFSEDVIDLGIALFKTFIALQRKLQKIYMKKTYLYEGIEFFELERSLICLLEQFDIKWTEYEKVYVKSLMDIERKARQLVSDAIESDRSMLEIERKLKNDFNMEISEDYQFKEFGVQFSESISKINAIINFEGHGRDDMNFSVIEAAKKILLKFSACESESLRKLAGTIIRSFEGLRSIFRKYSENIEVVDPQLRNNEDLVEAITEYEKCWEKGKVYFENEKRCNQLVYFSSVVEGLTEKYPDFKEKLECFDTEVFIILPMIMLLKRVDDEDQGLCETFLPQLCEIGSESHNLYKNIKSELFRLNKLFLSQSQCNDKKWGEASTGKQSVDNQNRVLKMKTLLQNNSKRKKITENKLDYLFYKTIEEVIINSEDGVKAKETETSNLEKEAIEKILRELHSLSFLLQRNEPVEWNSFLDICIFAKV